MSGSADLAVEIMYTCRYLCCIITNLTRNSRPCIYAFLATDPEALVRFPALPEKKRVVGLERGPLSLVSTTEELLDRKVAAPV
jgi:hypothetical protein